jgi:hypothetical protein
MLFTATAFQAFTTTRDNHEVALSNRFEFSYDLDTNNKQARDLVIGTMLNRLFRYLSLQKQTGARFTNLSHPVLLQFKVGKSTSAILRSVCKPPSRSATHPRPSVDSPNALWLSLSSCSKPLCR